MEKHESIEEELDHWTKMRNSRRSKQLREQRVQRAQGKASHHTKEEER